MQGTEAHPYGINHINPERGTFYTTNDLVSSIKKQHEKKKKGTERFEEA